jgi:hypothetical protein
MPRLLYRRASPLVYPGGTPGFDPTHIAAQKVLFSGVALNGNFISLGSGVVPTGIGTVSGTPSKILDPRIGPTIKFASATDALTFTFPNISYSPVTFAAILVMNNVTSGVRDCIFGNNTNQGASGTSLGYDGSGHTWCTIDTVSFRDSTLPAAVAGVPYFVLVSILATSGTPTWLAMRLDTGQIFQATPSLSASFSAATTLVVGNNIDVNHVSFASIAAAMMSNTFIPPATALQWAQSPWDFWYPPRIGNVIFLSAFSGPQASPVVVQNHFLSIMGVGQ